MIVDPEQLDALMSLALAEGSAAGADGDVPVGAVIAIPTDGGYSVIGRGRNRRELHGDPTAHAEIEALRDAAKRIGHWRVEGTLIVTQEPCPMCAGALVNARVKQLIYGCENPKAGAVSSLYTICTDTRLNHRLDVRGGLRADECAGLLRSFFENLRSQGQH
jgi:tRNA(adenine34) deaminase